MPRGTGSVVQAWVAERCTYKMQTMLLSALRGCDGQPKENPSKTMTRMLRSYVLNSAHKRIEARSFMDFPPDTRNNARDFVLDLDRYPAHWVLHYMHAVEILHFKHPDEDAQQFWGFVYKKMIHALHVRPETEQDLNERLADDL